MNEIVEKALEELRENKPKKEKKKAPKTKSIFGDKLKTASKIQSIGDILTKSIIEVVSKTNKELKLFENEKEIKLEERKDEEHENVNYFLATLTAIPLLLIMFWDESKTQKIKEVTENFSKELKKETEDFKKLLSKTSYYIKKNDVGGLLVSFPYLFFRPFIITIDYIRSGFQQIVERLMGFTKLGLMEQFVLTGLNFALETGYEAVDWILGTNIAESMRENVDEATSSNMTFQNYYNNPQLRSQLYKQVYYSNLRYKFFKEAPNNYLLNYDVHLGTVFNNKKESLIKLQLGSSNIKALRPEDDAIILNALKYYFPDFKAKELMIGIQIGEEMIQLPLSSPIVMSIFGKENYESLLHHSKKFLETKDKIEENLRLQTDASDAQREELRKQLEYLQYELYNHGLALKRFKKENIVSISKNFNIIYGNLFEKDLSDLLTESLKEIEFIISMEEDNPLKTFLLGEIETVMDALEKEEMTLEAARTDILKIISYYRNPQEIRGGKINFDTSHLKNDFSVYESMQKLKFYKLKKITIYKKFYSDEEYERLLSNIEENVKKIDVKEIFLKQKINNPHHLFLYKTKEPIARVKQITPPYVMRHELNEHLKSFLFEIKKLESV